MDNDIHGQLLIETDDPFAPLLEVEVTGKILPEFSVTPAAIDIGRIKTGHSYVQTLVVQQLGPQEVLIAGVEAPAGVTAKVVRKETAPGDPSVHEITVTVVPTAVGRLSTTLNVLSNIPRMSRISVPITAEVVGVEYAVTPSILVFGPVPAGSSAGTITVTGGGNLDVAAVHSSLNDLLAGVKAVEPGKRYVVAVRVNKDASPGNKVGKLTLDLAEGNLIEKHSVNIYGTVAPE